MKFRRIVQAVSHYITFFLLVGFVTTCCMMLFLNTMRETTGVEYTAGDITMAAKLTLLNVAVLTLLFTVIDWVRRKLTVDRPIRRITAAADKLIKGDFSARVKPISHDAGQFNEVIDCFNKLAGELSSVETLRTDFIANVSHELKTPLAVMQNYGQLLQQPGLDDATRMEYGKAVSDAARRLSSMITNILKLNRLENQQIFPHTEEYDLSQQLCDCLLQFEDVWEEKNIDLHTDIEDSVTVKADAELFSLVWNNLFSNAFKFTEPGGTVSVRLTSTAHHAIVTVTDTGCGMTPEVGAHIFEKFYQGDTSHATQGNGLGLALVKRVIDIMHGSIAVESAVGKGTSFTVRVRRS